jgi:hypothetical protein
MTRALLDPGRIIALAHGANPASWGRRMSPNYPALVTDFLALLESRQIPFVIVGGIALLQHVPARNTEEIDLILSARASMTSRSWPFASARRCSPPASSPN